MICHDRAWIIAALACAGLTFDGSHRSYAQPTTQCAPTQIQPGPPAINGIKGEGSITIVACVPGDLLIGQGQGLPGLRRTQEAGLAEIVYFKPCELPSGSDLPGAGVRIAFVSGNKSANATRSVTLAADFEKPTLTTTSNPTKGTKVDPKQKIVVRMQASERYDATRLGWQTGLKKIQLRDESRNRDVSPHFEASGGPAPCDRKIWEQTLEVAYEVPDNPPPIIKLRSCAWDHANHQDCDVAEFPTGEIWAGTIRLVKDQRNPKCSAIRSEASYTIVVRGDGDVSGSGTFNHSSYTCEGGFTAPATKGTIELVGKKTGSTLMVYVNDWEPKNAFIPRLPGGQQIVQIADGTTAEGTFNPGIPEVMFSVRLECRTCGKP